MAKEELEKQGEQNLALSVDVKKNVEKLIDKIKADTLEGTIVDYEVQTIQGMDDSEIGYTVIIELKTSCGYTDGLLDQWKKMFCAEQYWIKVVGKRLVVKFLCYN